MSNTNNNQYNGPTNTCPCGNDTGSPQHTVCVHCAAEIVTSEDHKWDEFWAEWDDTGEE